MMNTTKKIFFELYYRNKSEPVYHNLSTLPTSKPILETVKPNLPFVPRHNLAVSVVRWPNTIE